LSASDRERLHAAVGPRFRESSTSMLDALTDRMTQVQLTNLLVSSSNEA
jgi:hypothetical protein